MTVELAAELRAVASRVRRLMVYDRYPERFHEDKDSIAHDIVALAERLAPSTVGMRRAKGIDNPQTVLIDDGLRRVDGRLVRVQRRTVRRQGFAIFVEKPTP